MQTFNTWYNYITFGLLGMVTAIVVILLFLAWRNPVLFKLGLRNIPRRPAQSILIVLGLTLSTIIVVSSFATGDTLNYSVQRQAVSAYGQIDEIIAPPLLSMFASMDAGVESEAAAEAQDLLGNLTEGGLTSVIALLDGGLPGISTDRLEQLKLEAEQEPLIDGVAGSILFPTIIRNSTTGQGEPIGFIFAVDDDYDQQFGLTSIDGEPLEVERLGTGVGNVFLQAANLFSMVGDLGQRAGINLSASNVATAVAAIGAVLGGSQDGNLLNTVIDVATLQELGIDTTLLEENGITEINVAELIDSVPGLRDLLGTLGGGATEGAADGAADSENPIAELLPQAAPALPQESAALQPGSPLTSTATLSPTQPLTATEALAATATGTPTTATLPAEEPGAIAGLIDRGQNLLGSFNLNTLNSELDRVLGQVGLQLRQGDVYLNRLGAERLGAEPGDLLEVFIGPIPVPFRVRAIVEEASPLGALLPVVVMRLDEGQQLLFMSGKVNNVLVSNEGDMLEGVQHTAAVSERLSVLAMDPDALAETVELLRRPSITAAIQEGAAKPLAGLVDEEVPDFLVNIMGNFADFEGQTAAIADLAAGLDGDTLTEGMRSALANTEVRTWILNQNLSEADRTSLADSMSELNQFDVLTPLSKETVLAAAGIGGSIFSSLFSIFGFFSVVAGILLIFLIYVMLAAERRSEMGIARAIGVQRPHLVQMFVSEGMVYSLAAGALGVLIGLGVSFVMIEYLGSIVNSVAGQLSATSAGILEFTFRVSPRTIIISYCLGVLFTFAIVFISSWRVSRLNIVAAIRDLPDNANARPRTVSGRIGRWIGPVLLLALGGVVLWYGFQWTVWSVVLIGATLLLFGIMQLVSRLLEAAHLRGETAARITYTLVGFGLLALWILPWQRFLPQLGLEQFAGDPTQILAVFAIGGPMIITGAIMVIMFNAAFFTGIIGFVFGGIGSLAPVLKTAIAYPLSTRFRTGVAMILFAMIMATVVVMSIVIQATQSLIVLDERESGGFTIQTSDTLLSFFDRMTDMEGEIARSQERYPLLAEVENVGAVASQWLQISTAPSDAESAAVVRSGDVNVAGMTDGYLAQVATVYGFSSRAAGFESDAAIWEALRTRDDVAIIRNTLVDDEVAQVSAGLATPTPVVIMGMEFEDDEGDFQYLPFAVSSAEVQEGFAPIEVELSSALGATPRTRTVQIIGVLEEGAMLNNEPMQVNIATLNALLDEPATFSNHYLTVRPGADVHEVAMEVERAFLSSGIDATVMAERFEQGQAFTRNILRLLQGFMALGLLVGIAGLGVITTRTVVERRQQVGMLRAIGYPARSVAASFVLEASFIAITGLVIGTLTGIVLGLNIVGVAFGNLDAFRLPWGSILLVLGLAYGFALLTTIVPAWQASRIYPAEALRYE